MAAALSFQSVTKDFRGAREYRALRDDLVGAASRLVGVRRSPRGVVRALDDVSFEVPEGEALGLIGPNGAGKTTALKIATRISYPTSGRMRVRGRVGALIEVGTGMHPELSGRENVSLYGRILGLSKRDVAGRFDEIVEFAGVERAIDQPVKQYSSGMQLRLGFSIAAHLEPDVLLVDEALAVGDAAFQQRCIGRMNDIVRGGGTLVYVSHDMATIETLCSHAILLECGRITMTGLSRDVVATYLRGATSGSLQHRSSENAALEIVHVSLIDSAGRVVDRIPSGDAVTVRLHYRASEPVVHPAFSVGIGDGSRETFAGASMLIDGATPDVLAGEGHVDCEFAELPLQPRVYELWCGVRGEDGRGAYVPFQRSRLFEVTGALPPGPAAATFAQHLPVKLPYRWTMSGSG